MASHRIWLVAAATAMITAAACSSDHSGSRAKPELKTGAGQALTITPEQMLAATDGDTPVAYAKPEHGTITYGANGAMIYTPDAGFTGTDQLHLTSTASVKLYAENLPPLATIGGGAVQANAHGSAIAPVPGSSDEIYGLTDRGLNVAGRTPNEIVLPIPDFHPQIAKLKLADGVASVQRIITLAGKDGAPLVGLSPPQATSGEVMVDINSNPLTPSDHGLDAEGLVALPDGTFWIADEYGPFIVHFDANGKELERLSPFDGTLPKELSLRGPNHGLKGFTVTPDGTTLVAIMQSALQTPGLAGPSTSVPITRIVTIKLANRGDVHEYLYPLANPQQTKVAVSEITAVTNTTFLVDELDGEPQPKGNKKIYLADISGATDVGPRANVAGTSYQADRGGLLVNGVPIETFVGISGVDAATEKLGSAGITVAGKKLKLDLTDLLGSLPAAGSFFGHAKIEGIITPDGGKTIMVANDSDFGLQGLASTTPPFALKPKTLPNGAQNSGEILTVDLRKLPPTMEAETIPIKVG
ncbi:esterase-like activity of phytase family protein [Mycobacterium genavense]|uniref:esterase-like activity of phytase family protein n=1 Tax=Mycobacterium genavense TaxID=36812 RepID=UPI000A0455DE|nr:esterase-like activity of phytase family protein [Mycobacterium genavense]